MRKILLAFLAILLFTTLVQAVDVQEYQSEQFGMEALEDAVSGEASELVPEFSITDPVEFSDGLQSILSGAIPYTGSALIGAVQVSIAMTAVVLLCSIAMQMETKLSRNAVLMAGTLGISLLSVASFHAMVGLGRDTLEQLQSFTGLLLPVLGAATAASGGTMAASAIQVATIFVSNLLMGLINRFLVPMTYAFIAVSAADAVLGNQTLKRTRDLVKWAITKSMKLVVFLFTGYIGLSGVIAGAGDETAIKAAKLAVSSVVPVVGGMISDASETVLASAQILRSAAGIFGMLAVLAICILPLLRIGIQHLILKVTAAACGTVGEKPLVDLIESLADAMGFLMGMTGTCGFMLLISCVCFVKAVSP